MYFKDWHAFLAMGGHGVYVWLAYGVSLLSLLGLVWYLWRAEKSFWQSLDKREARARRRAQRSMEEVIDEPAS
ncbi:heme exporter protein CcmD [Gallaecimonas kandeliae]|uniref:heme exporter protein CcmD n=1 Tax=Gallaecimonas kandeliae TaxID=3029055 RepID=UPI00264A22B4|nr:heme exporter protein CcmD [Gallaecimonas kandeliae]WKE66771.1 heme exporter protein CcmD [Gallaecimonas kandeliae]